MISKRNGDSLESNRWAAFRPSYNHAHNGAHNVPEGEKAMQFALLIYHAPEEFSMRKKATIAILVSAPGGLTTKRSSRLASTSALMR